MCWDSWSSLLCSPCIRMIVGTMVGCTYCSFDHYISAIFYMTTWNEDHSSFTQWFIFNIVCSPDAYKCIDALYLFIMLVPMHVSSFVVYSVCSILDMVVCWGLWYSLQNLTGKLILSNAPKGIFSKDAARGNTSNRQSTSPTKVSHLHGKVYSTRFYKVLSAPELNFLPIADTFCHYLSTIPSAIIPKTNTRCNCMVKLKYVNKRFAMDKGWRSCTTAQKL